MSKRQLTRRQRWRIEKIQQERIRRSDTRDDRLEQAALESEEPGMVISHFGQTLDIEAENGEVVRCFARQNIGDLVTGDQVTFCRAEPTGVVTARLERQNLLQRPDKHKIKKPIAANIDQVFVVISVEPEPIAHRLDRTLVSAEVQGLSATIVLNKIDLINDDNRESLENLVKAYRAIGYEVIETSTKVAEGLQPLIERVRDKTSIFVGPSGIGKSSLINALFGNDMARVGEISAANRRGRHTTTTARLYHYQETGQLIDSPGIREFGLWHLSAGEILGGFVELKPLLGDCQFRNCLHDEKAQNCAIQKARLNGGISTERFDSYLRMLDEMEL